MTTAHCYDPSVDDIGISSFKAQCFRLLARVKRSGKKLTVLRNGEPLVVIYPAPSPGKRPDFGVSKGTATIVGDIVAPLPEDEWDALL